MDFPGGSKRVEVRQKTDETERVGRLLSPSALSKKGYANLRAYVIRPCLHFYPFMF